MANQVKRSPRKPKVSSAGTNSTKGETSSAGAVAPVAKAPLMEASTPLTTHNNATMTENRTPPSKATTESPLPVVGSAQNILRHAGAVSSHVGGETNTNKRTMTIRDIETVQNLIEKCLQLYLTKDEVISVLREQATIDAEFTKLIWGRLEGENPQFFKCYNTRLKLKAQITMFNHLLEQQIDVVRRMKEGWNTYPNASATASGIPLFQSGSGQFGFEDQGMRVEQMDVGQMDDKVAGIKGWNLGDLGLEAGE